METVWDHPRNYQGMKFLELHCHNLQWNHQNRVHQPKTGFHIENPNVLQWDETRCLFRRVQVTHSYLRTQCTEYPHVAGRGINCEDAQCYWNIEGQHCSALCKIHAISSKLSLYLSDLETNSLELKSSGIEICQWHEQFQVGFGKNMQTNIKILEMSSQSANLKFYGLIFKSRSWKTIFGTPPILPK